MDRKEILERAEKRVDNLREVIDSVFENVIGLYEERAIIRHQLWLYSRKNDIIEDDET